MKSVTHDLSRLIASTATIVIATSSVRSILLFPCTIIVVIKGVDLTGLSGGHKKAPSGVQGRSPGRGSGGQSPTEDEAFFVKLHIIFALKYNKQQLLLDKINNITSKILGGGRYYHGRPPLHKY